MARCDEPRTHEGHRPAAACAFSPVEQRGHVHRPGPRSVARACIREKARGRPWMTPPPPRFVSRSGMAIGRSNSPFLRENTSLIQIACFTFSICVFDSQTRQEIRAIQVDAHRFTPEIRILLLYFKCTFFFCLFFKILSTLYILTPSSSAISFRVIPPDHIR